MDGEPGKSFLEDICKRLDNIEYKLNQAVYARKRNDDKAALIGVGMILAWLTVLILVITFLWR